MTRPYPTHPHARLLVVAVAVALIVAPALAVLR
jgi:hypothetical protein